MGAAYSGRQSVTNPVAIPALAHRVELANGRRPQYPTGMADDDDIPEPSGNLDDLPVIKRDYGFAFKLVAALVVGITVAVFVGAKLRSTAAGCGADLIQPGRSVIPPTSEPADAAAPR